jgi:hypothetical protein
MAARSGPGKHAVLAAQASVGYLDILPEEPARAGGLTVLQVASLDPQGHQQAAHERQAEHHGQEPLHEPGDDQAGHHQETHEPPHHPLEPVGVEPVGEGGEHGVEHLTKGTPGAR